MKNSKSHLKRLAAFAFIFALVSLVSAMLGGGIETFPDVLTQSDTYLMSGPAATIVDEVVTTEKAKEASPDLLADDIEPKYVETSPARTPLDTLLRKVSKRTITKSLNPKYYSVDFREFTDTSTAAITAANQEVFEIPVTNIKLWLAGDRVMLPGVTGYNLDGSVNANAALICYIYEKDKTNSKLKVQPINGYRANATSDPVLKTGDDVPSSQPLTRMGQASSELAIKENPYAIMPEPEFNYVQKRIATVSESTWQKVHNKEVDFTIEDMNRMAVRDMKATKELDLYFGFRSRITSEASEDVIQTSGGVSEFSSKRVDMTGTLNNPAFQSMARQIFAGNGGNDTQVMLVGSGAMERMSSIEDYSKQLEAANTYVNHGLTFKKITANIGQFKVVYSPMLDQAGYSYLGISLDMEYLKEKFFQKPETIKQNLKATGEADADRITDFETSCVEIQYPELHAFIDFTPQ